MTPHRREAWKALFLALTALAVCCLPVLSPAQFVYLAGIASGVVGLLSVGRLLALYGWVEEFWAGFLAFEEWTAAEAKRRFRGVRW